MFQVMENINLSSRFVDALERKIPQKSVLVNTLADLLIIEKESVYRRLRKEIPFTLIEVGLIAKELGVSLDKIVHANDNYTNPMNYLWESYQEYYLFDAEKLGKFSRLMHNVASEDDSEAGFIMNSLDPFFFSIYDSLSQFILFKWIYKYDKNVHIHFEDIKPEKEYLKFKRESLKSIIQLKSICYILDHNIISNFINDLLYFEHIHLIRKESIELIKKDLLKMLHDLEKAAAQGRFTGSDTLIELYVSNTSISQACSFIGSSNFFLSVLISFELLTCTSKNSKNYQAVKSWFERVKGLSTPISVSCEKERILFFEAQRALVEKL